LIESITVWLKMQIWRCRAIDLGDDDGMCHLKAHHSLCLQVTCRLKSFHVNISTNLCSLSFANLWLLMTKMIRNPIRPWVDYFVQNAQPTKPFKEERSHIWCCTVAVVDPQSLLHLTEYKITFSVYGFDYTVNRSPIKAPY